MAAFDITAPDGGRFRITAPDGASVKLSRQGGHVLSWLPAGGAEQLYRSPRSEFVPGKAILTPAARALMSAIRASAASRQKR